MTVLTQEGWNSFEESIGWREVVAIVKIRMGIINRELLSPNSFIGLSESDKNEKRAALQAEYLSCLWFINLPKPDVGEKKDEKNDPDFSDLPKSSRSE